METSTIQSIPSTFHSLNQRCDETPYRVAILSEDVSITYQELDGLTNSVGAYLHHKRIDQTDLVLVILPRGITMALLSIGISKHAICVPVNPEATSSEINKLLTSINPRLVFTNASLKSVITGCSNLPEGIPVEEIALKPESKSWRFFGDPAFSKRDGQVLPQLDDIAFLLMTSGSTSTPKLVPLSHENIAVSAQHLIESLNLTAADRCLNTMTMFHVGGLLDLLIAPLTLGCTVICPSNTGAPSFFKLLQKHHPTWYQCVPTVLSDIVNYAEQERISCPEKSELRLIRSVSSPLSIELAEKAESLFGVPVIEIYGMTETAGVIASNPLPPAQRKPNSVGKVVGDLKIQVIDGQNNPLPTNIVGEVIVSGPSVFSGYFQNLANNKDLFIGNWFRTGDTGLIDEDGFIHLKGRVKEIINRGGEKISPLEIDQVLQSHPNIAEAATFSISHATLGEEVAAAVVLNSNHSFNEQELRTYLSQHLTRFKQPRTIIIVEQLPRNSGGKLQRHLLTKHFSGQNHTVQTELDKPTTELEGMVVKMWKKILDIKQVSIHDNFFDLGGDSLRATLFVTQLERKIGNEIDPKIIYEFPVLSDFTQQLEAQSIFKPSKTAASREELYAELQRLMAFWPGSRLSDESLIVGRNIVGSKTPIYWCTHGIDYFEEQIKYFDSDQPFYGMVDLYESKFRSVENNARAARIYADEIVQLAPYQEIIIGGWCEGVKLMIDTANLVQQAGTRVKLLFMQDNFIPKPYSRPVAFFFSDYASNRYRDQYIDPDFGISKYYTGGYVTKEYNLDHTDFYKNPETMKLFASELNTVIDRIDEIGQAESLTATSHKFQQLEPSDYRASIKLKQPPLILEWGETTGMEVEVENKSETTWQPSTESGIILMITWLDYKYSRVAKDKVVLTDRVAPGEKVTLPVELKTPTGKSGGKVLLLQIDLVDDGIARFASHASKAVRFPTLSSTMMFYPVLLLNKSKKLRWLESTLWYRSLNAKSLPIVFTNLSIRMIRKLRDFTYKYTE